MNGLLNIHLCAYFGCVPFTVAYSTAIYLPLRNTSLREYICISLHVHEFSEICISLQYVSSPLYIDSVSIMWTLWSRTIWAQFNVKNALMGDE
jgi:hypothetical protein